MRRLFASLIPLITFAFPAFSDELPSFDAIHCELYVNSFGVADLSYQGIEEKVLVAELILDEAQLTRGRNVRIVRAGAGLLMRVINAEVDGGGRAILTVNERRRVSIAERQFGPTHRVYFTFEHLELPQTVFEEVLDFAFFVDVLRTDGETVRLWQKDRGGTYTMQTVFGTLPTTDVSLGSGVMHYPAPSSLIYDFKRECAVLGDARLSPFSSLR